MSDNFADSNVVLYLFDQDDAFKRGVARRIFQEGLVDRNLHISFQVVQEVLNVLTRKLAQPLGHAEARRLLNSVLSDLWHVMPSTALYYRALDISERYHFSFYDSLIVAAAIEAGCTRLFSEDLQHGQTIDYLRIENPFLRI